MESIYKTCPSFETRSFIIRLVDKRDANDLLTCYSDLKAQELFNDDNCLVDFNIYTVDKMKQYIDVWRDAYDKEEYIRFAVIDKLYGKAVGTIEMFGMIGKYKTDIGILRIDLASNYEKELVLKEILDVCIFNFYILFGVKTIATKAIDKASSRINVLTESGFSEKEFKGRQYYYLRSQ